MDLSTSAVPNSVHKIRYEKLNKILCVLLILLGLACPVSNAYARNQVTAEGMATIHNSRMDIARDKAIDNAQRNAIEKVMGVMIYSGSEVENYQLKVDRILSESRGFINGYSIVSENGTDDVYTVTIEADIGAGKLKDRMEAMNLIMARKSKPRIMILFNQHSKTDFVAEAALTRFFLARDFKLVDSGSFKKNSTVDHLQLSCADLDTLARYCHQSGAEVVLLGSVDVSSNTFNLSGIEMHSNKVVVSVKAINADTGDVIATGSEACSAAGMKDDVKSITEEATGKVAKKLIEDIFDRWSSELTNAVTVKLSISGLDTYQELERFKGCLPDVVKGYRELYQRSYSRGTADLDLEVRGNVHGVANDLSTMTLDKRRIRILGISSNRIEAVF